MEVHPCLMPAFFVYFLFCKSVVFTLDDGLENSSFFTALDYENTTLSQGLEYTKHYSTVPPDMSWDISTIEDYYDITTPGDMDYNSSYITDYHTETDEDDDEDDIYTNPEKRVATAEERLIRDLFRYYDSNARAVLNSSDTVIVEVRYTLLRIQKLDERTQVLHTTGLVITEWKDERLMWDPSYYGNLTDLVVPPHLMWTPTLTLMNGAEEMIHDFDRMKVVISYDGSIHWEPGGIFTTTCDIDITFFPFDYQECPVIVGAWAYYSQRMNLTNATSTIVLHEYKESGEWDLLATSVHWAEESLQCCPEVRYPYVVSKMVMRRRTAYYMIHIIVPCMMLSGLVLVVFWIPPAAGEKISCGISVLLAFTVFLLMVSESIPRTSLQLPLLVAYLMSTMLLGAVSICLAILVLNAHHMSPRRPMPKWLQILMFRYVARLLLLKFYANTSSSNHKRKKYSIPNKVQPNIDGDKFTVVCHDDLQRNANELVLHNKDKTTESLTVSCSGSHEGHLQTQEDSYDTAFTFQETETISTQMVDNDASISDDATQMPLVRKKTNKSPSSRTEVDDVRKLGWKDLAQVLDRFFFFTVLLSTTTTTAVILCLPYYYEL